MDHTSTSRQLCRTLRPIQPKGPHHMYSFPSSFSFCCCFWSSVLLLPFYHMSFFCSMATCHLSISLLWMILMLLLIAGYNVAALVKGSGKKTTMFALYFIVKVHYEMRHSGVIGKYFTIKVHSWRVCRSSLLNDVQYMVITLDVRKCPLFKGIKSNQSDGSSILNSGRYMRSGNLTTSNQSSL